MQVGEGLELERRMDSLRGILDVDSNGDDTTDLERTGRAGAAAPGFTCGALLATVLQTIVSSLGESPPSASRPACIPLTPPRGASQVGWRQTSGV